MHQVFILLLGFFLFSCQAIPSKTIAPAVKLDLYVMGFDPFSSELENTLAMVGAEMKHPIQINLYYIAQETPDGNFQSLRGPAEVEEDMRQLVIRKYYPDKLWKYLQSRNSDYRSSEWKSDVYWAGLPADEIVKKVEQEGKTLLKENIQKARQMGIQNSPLLYINDQPYQGSRSLPALTRAILQQIKDPKKTQIPVCFSDADCVDLTGEKSGRCLNPGKPTAGCEFFTVGLKIILPRSDFPLDTRFFQGMSQQIPNLKPMIQPTAWDSPEGQEILAKIPTQTLPLYVWGENFELLDVIPTLQNAGFLQSQDLAQGKKIYWFSMREIPSNFYLNRPPKPSHADLFVMSQCPFGTWAENQILPLAREKGITVDIHYIMEGASPLWTSLHGAAEMEENIRQACIKKYFPDRHADYILERNKDFKSGLWEDAAAKVCGEGSLETIRSCASGEEGKQLLVQEVELTQELGITSSPTILWENQYRFNNLLELKQGAAVFSNIDAGSQGSCGQR